MITGYKLPVDEGDRSNLEIRKPKIFGTNHIYIGHWYILYIYIYIYMEHRNREGFPEGEGVKYYPGERYHYGYFKNGNRTGKGITI